MKKLILLMIPFLILSCKKDSVLDKPISSNAYKSGAVLMSPMDVPYATDEELNNFINDDNIVNYKVARYYAYAEIENALYHPLQLETQNYRISQKPVIIYDYDSKPKYYEFSILKKNMIYATITTIAKKESSNMVVNIFNHPLSYEDKQDHDFIVSTYPAVFLGNISSSGQAPINLISLDDKTPVYIGSTNLIQNYQELISKMDAESQSEHSTAIVDLQNELADINSDLVNFWQNADGDKTRIVALNDEDILDEVANGIYGKVNATNWDEYIIPAYNSENMKRTRWNGWCGPSAIAWAYRGLYTTYSKNTSANYLRIHGDAYSNFFEPRMSFTRSIYNVNDDATANANSDITDFGLYKKLRSYCTKTGAAYPMYITGMRNAMKNVTGNSYTVNLTTSGHTRIRNNKLPLLTMIGYGGSFHYLIAFGSGYEKRNNGSIKRKFLYVTDNGQAIGRHNNYPYWRSQSPDPGIHYKVEQL